MIKKKYAFGILLLTLFAFIFFVSVKRNETILPAIPDTTTPDTTLSFSPNPLLLPSHTGAIDIVIDTGKNTVNFVQIKLVYDPSKLSDVIMTQGDFMKEANVLENHINQETGSITYMLSLPKNKKPVQGRGSIATMSFTTTLDSQKETYLNFSKDTLVTNAFYTSSLLKKTLPGTIQYTQ